MRACVWSRWGWMRSKTHPEGRDGMSQHRVGTLTFLNLRQSLEPKKCSVGLAGNTSDLARARARRTVRDGDAGRGWRGGRGGVVVANGGAEQGPPHPHRSGLAGDAGLDLAPPRNPGDSPHSSPIHGVSALLLPLLCDSARALYLGSNWDVGLGHDHRARPPCPFPMGDAAMHPMHPVHPSSHTPLTINRSPHTL